MENTEELMNERMNFMDFVDFQLGQTTDVKKGSNCCYKCGKVVDMDTKEGSYRPSKKKCICFNLEGIHSICIRHEHFFTQIHESIKTQKSLKILFIFCQ